MVFWDLMDIVISLNIYFQVIIDQLEASEVKMQT